TGSKSVQFLKGDNTNTKHAQIGVDGVNTFFATDGTSNVGIGTDSPTGKLHVAGGTAAADTSGTSITLQAQTGGAHTAADPNGGSIVLIPGAAGANGAGADGYVQIGAAGQSGELRL